LPEKEVNEGSRLGDLFSRDPLPVLELIDASAVWSKGTEPILSGVNLSLGMDQLLGVVGSVGTGKVNLTLPINVILLDCK